MVISSYLWYLWSHTAYGNTNLPLSPRIGLEPLGKIPDIPETDGPTRKNLIETTTQGVVEIGDQPGGMVTVTDGEMTV